MLLKSKRTLSTCFSIALKATQQWVKSNEYIRRAFRRKDATNH